MRKGARHKVQLNYNSERTITIAKARLTEFFFPHGLHPTEQCTDTMDVFACIENREVTWERLERDGTTTWSAREKSGKQITGGTLLFTRGGSLSLSSGFSFFCCASHDPLLQTSARAIHRYFFLMLDMHFVLCNFRGDVQHSELRLIKVLIFVVGWRGRKDGYFSLCLAHVSSLFSFFGQVLHGCMRCYSLSPFGWQRKSDSNSTLQARKDLMIPSWIS